MTGFLIASLSDARLAAHALSPMPAWLWSADGTRILWANPTGAAIFRAENAEALSALRFEPAQPSAAQIIRLAGTLPNGDMPRLERLRGFGAYIGGVLTCLCSRFAMPDTSQDNSPAILVVATERAGPNLPLDDRLLRLLAGSEKPVAAFSADGQLLRASDDARALLADATDLSSLGADRFAEQASRDGHSEGNIPAGAITLDRLGAGNTLVLLLTVTGESARATPPVTGDVATPASATSAPKSPIAARQTPLRFVWQVDDSDNFTIESDEFLAIAGEKTAALIGRPIGEMTTTLGLDPQGRLAAALASHDTFSGIALQWPTAGDPLPVELSGLPAFDRDRKFSGYRGFAICRDIAGINALIQRRSAPAAAPVPTPANTVENPAPVMEEARESNAKVLPFRAPPVDEAPALSPREQTAFQEIARTLSDRLKSTASKATREDDFGPERAEPIAEEAHPKRQARAAPVRENPVRDNASELAILDRMPVGVLIYRLNDLIFANRAFLEWTGYSALEALREAGGLDSLFIEPRGNGGDNGAKSLTITTPSGKQMPVEGKLFTVTWNGDNALVLMLNTLAAPRAKPDKNAELALRRIETENRELKAVLDTATDGVLLIDRGAHILAANRSAEALFGLDAADFERVSFGELFAPESARAVLAQLDRLARDGAAILLSGGDEVIGRVRQGAGIGGLVPLHITIGRIDEAGEKFCAVLRDITAWKRSEEELLSAKQHAENASAAKSEFLAKISHEIRTPLNSIIGFSEVMMQESFGSLGNDRYRDYLRDIHTAGGHLISLLNDLLDLSKIEAGKLDLTFTSLNINDLTQQCVAMMQDQANRERVIIRTSLPASVPQVVADARSVRQIVINLLSNAIKFTGAGGQVIVSTALTDDHEVVLRVRDTGAGMSPQELRTALEPFRQLATSARWGASGTGLGLPITKALTEANHAHFKITSAADEGTLAEVAFPATRVLAQ